MLDCLEYVDSGFGPSFCRGTRAARKRRASVPSGRSYASCTRPVASHTWACHAGQTGSGDGLSEWSSTAGAGIWPCGTPVGIGGGR